MCQVPGVTCGWVPAYCLLGYLRTALGQARGTTRNGTGSVEHFCEVLLYYKALFEGMDSGLGDYCTPFLNIPAGQANG